MFVSVNLGLEFKIVDLCGTSGCIHPQAMKQSKSILLVSCQTLKLILIWFVAWLVAAVGETGSPMEQRLQASKQFTKKELLIDGGWTVPLGPLLFLISFRGENVGFCTPN